MAESTMIVNDSLNENFSIEQITISNLPSHVKFVNIVKYGKLVVMYMRVDSTALSNRPMFTLPSNILPIDEYSVNNSSGVIGAVVPNAQGQGMGSFFINVSNGSSSYGQVSVYSEQTNTFTGTMMYLCK